MGLRIVGLTPGHITTLIQSGSALARHVHARHALQSRIISTYGLKSSNKFRVQWSNGYDFCLTFVTRSQKVPGSIPG